MQPGGTGHARVHCGVVHRADLAARGAAHSAVDGGRVGDAAEMEVLQRGEMAESLVRNLPQVEGGGCNLDSRLVPQR